MLFEKLVQDAASNLCLSSKTDFNNIYLYNCPPLGFWLHCWFIWGQGSPSIRWTQIIRRKDKLSPMINSGWHMLKTYAATAPATAWLLTVPSQEAWHLTKDVIYKTQRCDSVINSPFIRAGLSVWGKLCWANLLPPAPNSSALYSRSLGRDFLCGALMTLFSLCCMW